MAQVKRKSRSLFLIAAFVSVMSATGGLFGAIGGVILILLGKSMLGLAQGVILFVPTTAAIGMVVAALVGILMIVRNSPHSSFLPRFASARAAGVDS